MALFVAIAIRWAPVSAAPDLSQFNLVFSDEFNSATLDNTKWNTGFLWGPYLPINNEQQLYVDELGINASAMIANGGNTPSPFEMTGTSLKIKATEITDPNQIPPRPAENDSIWDGYPEYRYNGDDPNDPNDEFYDPANVDYLSGIITSYDAFRFTHGYAEARVKLPAGQGLWPAFWLLTSFYVEDVPEIDIMEFLGHDVGTTYHTYHYFEPQNNWNKISTPSYTSNNADFTADWHTFGVVWDPKELIWYVDGIEVRRISSEQYDIPNQAMYVLANLATGGNWPGAPDNTTPFPAELELDYIRVYQKDTPDTITQAVLDSDYHLMFEDNFSGNSLDTSKWNTHHLWGPYWQINNEEQFYPDVGDTHSGVTFNSPPISVSNGTLKITADVVDSTDLPAMPAATSADFENHPEWRHSSAYNNRNYQNSTNDPAQAASPFLPEYTSGIITTYDSFKFTHGYAEIRAKLPQGDGLWPAFWLLNGYYVDQQPEIDVIEMRGENPTELVHSYHLSPKDGGPPSYSWSSFSSGPEGFADGFRTYGIAWEPGKLDWYIDGVKKHSHTGVSVSTQNMYAILNLAVGGNFVSNVDLPLLPTNFEIDRIRIYQSRGYEPVISVDSISPAVQTMVPSDNGTYVVGLSTLSGTSSDNLMVDRVELQITNSVGEYWNGSGWQSTHKRVLAVGTDYWSYMIDLSIGNYTLVPVVFDKSGNWVHDVVKFTVGLDSTSPSIQNLVPVQNGIYEAGTLTLNGTSSDNVSVDRVELQITNATGQYWNGSAWQSEHKRVLAVGTDSWSFPIDLAAGSYTLVPVVFDGAGNWVHEVIKFYIGSDSLNPTIQVATPALNVSNAAGTVMMTGTAADNANVDRVELQITNAANEYWNGSAWQAVNRRVLATGTDTWSYPVNLPVGSYTLVPVVFDKSGNWAHIVVPFNVGI